LGNAGSVSFLFDQYGVFRLKPDGVDRDELELELIDFGLEELDDGTNDDGDPLILLRCARESFGVLQDELEARKIEVDSSGFEWIPKTMAELSDEEVDAVIKLIDRLEEDDDVQEVFHNLA
jgi:transcriptional/translational regulatory protein YebC/TACO1